jgi:hypothetical protein
VARVVDTVGQCLISRFSGTVHDAARNRLNGFAIAMPPDELQVRLSK